MGGNALLGAATLMLCVGLQAVVSVGLIQVVRKVAVPVREGRGSLRAILALQLMAAGLFLSFLLQVAIWATLFRLRGEFSVFGDAFYHSAVNYTTLGYGDIVMSDESRILGAFEAMNGVIMGGFAASSLFEVIRMIRNR